MRRRVVVVGSWVLFASLLAGCGGGGVTVDGKVVRGDKPYSRATDGDVSISLSSDGGKGGPYGGQVGEDGTFQLKGPNGGGPPPGTYKVAVTMYPPQGGGDSKAASKGPPVPVTKTLPETWEVSPSSKSFTLDLAKLK